MNCNLALQSQKQRKGGKMDDHWLGPYSINQHI